MTRQQPSSPAESPMGSVSPSSHHPGRGRSLGISKWRMSGATWAMLCYNCSHNSVSSTRGLMTASTWQGGMARQQTRGRSCDHKMGPCGTHTSRTREPPTPKQTEQKALCEGKERVRAVEEALLSAPPGRGLNESSKMHQLPTSPGTCMDPKGFLEERKCDYLCMHWKGREKNVKPPHHYRKSCYSLPQIKLYFPGIWTIISDLLAVIPEYAFYCCLHNFLCPSLPLSVT